MLKNCLMICVLLCVIVGLEIYRELHSFRVTHYEVPEGKWKGEKSGTIVFLSDLHNHVYGKENRKLLEVIRRENPVMILIGGDMLVGKKGVSFYVAETFVKELCEIAPVFHACGNHEQRMKEKERNNIFIEYKRQCISSGVRFLENDSEYVQIGENSIRISGLELPMESYEKFKNHKIYKEDVKARIGEKDRERIDILLAHNPEYTDAYLGWGAELTLCGHLHGGLICMPNGKSVITPQFHLFPRFSGEMTRMDQQTVIVSRGLGTHTVNVRLFNRAEVIAFRFSTDKVLER